MTWEELKEKAKEMGDTNQHSIHIYKENVDFDFYYFGRLEMKDGYGNTIIIENRTPEQMLMIMRGLE